MCTCVFVRACFMSMVIMVMIKRAKYVSTFLCRHFWYISINLFLGNSIHVGFIHSHNFLVNHFGILNSFDISYMAWHETHFAAFYAHSHTNTIHMAVGQILNVIFNTHTHNEKKSHILFSFWKNISVGVKLGRLSSQSMCEWFTLVVERGTVR